MIVFLNVVNLLVSVVMIFMDWIAIIQEMNLKILNQTYATHQTLNVNIVVKKEVVLVGKNVMEDYLYF